MALTVPGDSLRLYRSGDWDKPIRAWGSAFGRPAFSPDGKILAACFEPGSITLIDLVGGSPEMRLIQPDETSANWLAFTADGTRLVFASGESNCLHEWDLVALRDELQALEIDASILPQRATPIVLATRTRSDKDSAWVEFMPEKEKERKLLQKWAVVSATKDRAKVVECLEELHQVAPEDPRYANLLAWTLIQNRNATPDEQGRALELARLALAKDISQANVHNTLGVVFYRLGELEEAVSTLETARGLRGSSDTSFDDYFLTMAYARVGQIQPACEAWVRGLRSHLKSDALDEERRSACLESAFVLTGALAAQLRFN
jgi:tetratricopeptide (TPR) repeat protein